MLSTILKKTSEYQSAKVSYLKQLLVCGKKETEATQHPCGWLLLFAIFEHPNIENRVLQVRSYLLMGIPVFSNFADVSLRGLSAPTRNRIRARPFTSLL